MNISLREKIEIELNVISSTVTDIEKKLFLIDGNIDRIQMLTEEMSPSTDEVIFRNTELLFNPNKVRWPSDSVMDCYARGSRDLQAYKERIYGGGGDDTGPSNRGNMGPVPIYSGDINGLFQTEITVQEESVDKFVVSGEKLFVPGKDARQKPHGYVYVKSDNKWEQLETIPNASHVLSLCVMMGAIFVIASYRWGPSQLLQYAEVQDAWLVVSLADGDYKMMGNVTFHKIIDLDDSVLIFGLIKKPGSTPKACIYQYKNQERYIVANNPFPSPNSSGTRVSRLVHYNDGILYSANIALSGVYLPPSSRTLYFLNPTTIEKNNDPDIAWESEDEYIRDIVVYDGDVYIMTIVSESGSLIYSKTFKTRIWKSSNFKEWSLKAEVLFGAPPYSFEILEDTLFVALGNRSKGRGTEQSPGYTDIQSGDFYKLTI